MDVYSWPLMRGTLHFQTKEECAGWVCFLSPRWSHWVAKANGCCHISHWRHFHFPGFWKRQIHLSMRKILSYFSEAVSLMLESCQDVWEVQFWSCFILALAHSISKTRVLISEDEFWSSWSYTRGTWKDQEGTWISREDKQRFHDDGLEWIRFRLDLRQFVAQIRGEQYVAMKRAHGEDFLFVLCCQASDLWRHKIVNIFEQRNSTPMFCIGSLSPYVGLITCLRFKVVNLFASSTLFWMCCSSPLPRVLGMISFKMKGSCAESLLCISPVWCH